MHPNWPCAALLAALSFAPVAAAQQPGADEVPALPADIGDPAELDQGITESSSTVLERNGIRATDAEAETLPMSSEYEAGFRIDLERIKLDAFYSPEDLGPSGPVIPMSIYDAVQLALLQNQDIEIAELEPARAYSTFFSALGEFDPIWSNNLSYLESEQSSSSQNLTFGAPGATENYITQFESTIGGRLPWGTQYSLSLRIDDDESTFNDFIEEYSGGFTLSLTQPLLRGRGKVVNLARIRQAENSQRMSESNLRLSVMNSVSEIMRTYWELVGAIENLRVREKSLDNAQRLLRMTEQRLEIGTASPLDVVQSEAGLGTRHSDLLTAQAAVANAADNLTRLLNIRDGSRLAERDIFPTDRPNPEPPPLDLEESIELALENRPDIDAAKFGIANAEIDERTTRNEMLPRLDVSGTVFSGGRDHKLREMFRGARDQQDNSFTISINGEIPVPNRAARGAYHGARIGRRDAELQLERTIADLENNVRLAVREVRLSEQQIVISRQTRVIQETNLEAEENLLNLGLTTNFRVLEVEEDLTSAEVAEAQALISLEQAIINLHFAQGTLLQEMGVVYETPEIEPPVNFVESLVVGIVE